MTHKPIVYRKPEMKTLTFNKQLYGKVIDELNLVLSPVVQSLQWKRICYVQYPIYDGDRHVFEVNRIPIDIASAHVCNAYRKAIEAGAQADTPDTLFWKNELDKAYAETYHTYDKLFFE